MRKLLASGKFRGIWDFCKMIHTSTHGPTKTRQKWSQIGIQYAIPSAQVWPNLPNLDKLSISCPWQSFKFAHWNGNVVMSQMAVKNLGGTLRNEQEQSKFGCLRGHSILPHFGIQGKTIFCSDAVQPTAKTFGLDNIKQSFVQMLWPTSNGQ